MTDTIDSLLLLTLTTRFLCAGVLIQSVELLWLWRELPHHRLLGLQAPRSRWVGPTGSIRWIYSHPMSMAILMGRIAAATACFILPFDYFLAPWLLISLLGFQCYYNHRFRIIYQNGDTMFLIGLAAMAVAALDPRDAMLQAAAFAFLAFNVLLAYFMSGWDKLKSTHWRSGSLLVEIFWNHPHRFEPIGRLLARHRSLAVVGSWGVILLELLFPLCVLTPGPFFYGYLAAGLFFHIAISFTMGLHGFFWSFASAYPALYYVHASWWIR